MGHTDRHKSANTNPVKVNRLRWLLPPTGADSRPSPPPSCGHHPTLSCRRERERSRLPFRASRSNPMRDGRRRRNRGRARVLGHLADETLALAVLCSLSVRRDRRAVAQGIVVSRCGCGVAYHAGEHRVDCAPCPLEVGECYGQTTLRGPVVKFTAVGAFRSLDLSMSTTKHVSSRTA